MRLVRGASMSSEPNWAVRRWSGLLMAGTDRDDASQLSVSSSAVVDERNFILPGGLYERVMLVSV